MLTKESEVAEMTDMIVIAILVLIAGLAAGYIYKAKKSGKTCIGCPHAGQCGGASHSGGCSGSCSSCSGCSANHKAADDAPKTE